MSRNQKAPLLAFVLVALVCGLVLLDSVRGDASENQSAHAPAPTAQSAPTMGREPRLPVRPEPIATPQAAPTGAPDLVDPVRPVAGAAADVAVEADVSAGPAGETGLVGETQPSGPAEPAAQVLGGIVSSGHDPVLDPKTLDDHPGHGAKAPGHQGHGDKAKGPKDKGPKDKGPKDKGPRDKK